jgi:hypothetical protein
MWTNFCKSLNVIIIYGATTTALCLLSSIEIDSDDFWSWK